MSEKPEPIRLVPLHALKDDKLSPSNLELYELMYMETCVTAAALWNVDWNFCPVCLAQVNEEGSIAHLPRKAIEQ